MVGERGVVDTALGAAQLSDQSADVNKDLVDQAGGGDGHEPPRHRLWTWAVPGREPASGGADPWTGSNIEVRPG